MKYIWLQSIRRCLSRRHIKSFAPLALLLGLLAPCAYGQAPVALSALADKDFLALAGHMEVLVDPSGQLELADVIESHQDWQPRQANDLGYGFTKDVYWFRAHLRNDTDQPQIHYFTIGYPLLDDVRLTLLESGSQQPLASFVTGDLLPFESRPTAYPTFVFPLQLQPHTDYTALLRVATSSSMQVPVELWQPRKYATYQFREALLYGGMIGLIAIIALFDLLLWASIRMSSYLFGALSLGSYSLMQASLTGLGYAYFWPSSPLWNQVSLLVFGGISLLGLSLFTLRFLRLDEHSPRLARLYKCAAAACGLFVGAALLLPYQVAITLLLLMIALIPLSSYFTSLYAWRCANVREARFFVAGMTFFIGLTLIYIGDKVSLIPGAFFTEHTLHFGAIIAVVFMSLALADLVNQEREARDLAQQNAITNLEKYRGIFENSLEGLFQVGFAGDLLAANPAMAKLLGANNADDLMARTTSLRTLVPAHDASLQDLFQELRTHGQLQGFEAECRRLDGQTFWASISARKVDGSGSDSGSDPETGIFEGSIIDISERRASERRLNYLATHDSLTGLLNRLELEQRLDAAFTGAQQRDEHHALLMMDLDQFKIVNDTGGHGAGDELLRQVATIFNGYVRASDTLARIGGDEFVILLQNCTLSDADEIAQRLRQEIADFRFYWKERAYSVSISIGIVGIHRGSASIVEVMGMADTACFSAKERGRNRVVVHHEQDSDIPRRQTEMEMVSLMREAIHKDEMVLFHQRVACVDPAQETGDRYEILVRMRHNGQILPPAAFLPAAERYNLITELDRWVVNAYFRWLAQNRQALDTLALANINLSGQSVGDPGFADFILQTFDEYGIPPEKICFEITESAAIASLTDTRAFVERIRARGARFALDDFGSGFSSYGYLKSLPVSTIKIDGSFIRDILTDPIDYAMVRSMTEVAHIMGLNVVAEYVETAEILATLRELKVDLAQGWHLHKPELLAPPATEPAEASASTTKPSANGPL